MTRLPDRVGPHPGETPLETLSALAVAANAGGTLAGALPSLLEVLCRAGAWDLGHAYRVGPHEELLFPLDTWWPEGAADYAPFRASTAEIPIRSDGLVAQMRRREGPVWVEDIEATEWYLRRGGAMDAGLRSTLAFPIVGPRGVAAMIELLSRSTRPEDSEQIELARHAGIVIGQILEREDLEGRFRALFDLLPIPVGVTTLDDGSFAEANVAFADFVGRPRASIPGATPAELGIVVEGWEWEERIEELRASRGSLTTETTIRIRGAGDRRVIATISVVPWKGAPHLLASLIDVTRLRSAEHQVGRSRARVHALTARLMELQEQERAHLSRELHDQLGQRLTVLKIIVDRLGREDGVDEALAAEAAEIARDLIDDVRWMSFELRPAVLDQLGLAAAIRRYVERSAGTADLRVELQVDDSVLNLSDMAATACFRVLQEAVTNTLRHAEADTLTIRLAIDGDDTVLTVEDDGRGFDPSQTEHAMGLMIMRERAESVGGRLDVSSEGGTGTRVDVRLPAGGGRGRDDRGAP